MKYTIKSVRGWFLSLSFWFLLLSLLMAAINALEDVCSLNGDVVNGKCVCDPGWKGTKCSFLKLTTTNRITPGYYNKSMPTWSGGNVYFADNQYHIFVGSKAIPSSTDNLYSCNSAVIHLVSDISNHGPFYFKNTVLTNFNLNPFTILFNGTYIIYDMGYNHVPPIEPVDKCNVNGVYANYDFSNITIHMTYSTDINAPSQEWMQHQQIIIDPWPGTKDKTAWNCNLENPTAYIFENGTTILMYRAIPCQGTTNDPAAYEKIGIAIAPHWKGPYTEMKEAIFASKNVNNEDPFIWRNKRGFHVLTHGFYPSQQNWLNAGGYGYSLDGISWTYSGDNPWVAWTQWNDGTNQTWIRRQKPGLIFDKDMNPIYLINGVDASGGPGYQWGNGWTLMQPILP